MNPLQRVDAWCYWPLRRVFAHQEQSEAACTMSTPGRPIITRGPELNNNNICMDSMNEIPIFYHRLAASGLMTLDQGGL